MTRPLIAAALLLAATSASAGALPDGTYACGKISGSMFISLGSVTIDGDTYRGIDDDGDFFPYAVGADKRIEWTGGLGSLTSDGWTHRYSELSQDSQGKPLIRINYTSKTGNYEVLDCSPE